MRNKYKIKFPILNTHPHQIKRENNQYLRIKPKSSRRSEPCWQTGRVESPGEELVSKCRRKISKNRVWRRTQTLISPSSSSLSRWTTSRMIPRWRKSLCRPFRRIVSGCWFSVGFLDPFFIFIFGEIIIEILIYFGSKRWYCAVELLIGEYV